MTIYEVNKITDSLYAIKEDITDNKFPIFIYLIIGSEKAALIDTGLGTDNLKQTVRKITKLPIVVLHTHAHGDHIGADSLFSEIYLNLRENSFKESTDQRLKFIETHLKDKPSVYAYVKEHIVENRNVNYKNIEDGDIVDLGGIELEVISTPGHTLGSISYVNKKDGYAFTGDGIADIHWFDKQGFISVQGFLNTLNNFEEKAKGVEKIYAGHIEVAFGLELIHDLQTAARAIINGAEDKLENSNYQFLIHGDLYAHRQGAATIYYAKDKISLNIDTHP